MAVLCSAPLDSSCFHQAAIWHLIGTVARTLPQFGLLLMFLTILPPAKNAFWA